MDEIQIKHVIEAALLAAGRPLPLETLASLFSSRASELDKASLIKALDALADDYRDRGLELKEVASGYRIQIKGSMSDWLTPLWEERAPRYTRALMETLALIAYRQPITRAEIEEVRGVAVSTNIIRTLMERTWIRVVGHRDVPGKPAMFGTTREFLDYFGLKKLDDLPPLADIKDGLPELSPQSDLIDALTVAGGEDEGDTADGFAAEGFVAGGSSDATAAVGDLEDAAADEEAVSASGEQQDLENDEERMLDATATLQPEALEQDASSQAEAESEAIAAPESEAIPVPESEAMPMPESEATPVPESEAIPMPESEAIPVPESEAIPVPESAAMPVPPESSPQHESSPQTEQTAPPDPTTQSSADEEPAQQAKAR